VSFYFLYKKRL